MSPRTLTSAALAAALLALGSCRGPATPTLPPGPGLVTSDAEPPPGTSVHEVPAWREGDRLVYRKADRVRISLRVVTTDGGAFELLDEDSGRRTLVGPDQLVRGATGPGGEPGYELDPGDAQLSWPLWEGKRWATEFVSRGEGRGDVPLLALYECDRTEVITVPAGTFECLRIWRKVRVAAPGETPERTSLMWYAPEVGAFVLRLDEGLLTELTGFQSRPDAE